MYLNSIHNLIFQYEFATTLNELKMPPRLTFLLHSPPPPYALASGPLYIDFPGPVPDPNPSSL